MKEKLIHPTKRFLLILLIIDIVCLLIVAAIRHGDKDRSLRLYSQQLAKFWNDDDMKYSQNSIFYSTGNQITSSEVAGIRSKIQSKLIEDSYIDWTSEGQSWIEAYSGHYMEELRNGDVTLKANVYAVGGYFFEFHRIPLVSGSYLDMESYDYNQIVLDENVAWNLFGGSDIIGKKMWIGESIFTVVGVVEVGDSDAETQAYGEYDAVYVPINAYSSIRRAGKSSSDEKTEEKQETTVYVDCYEALIPSPVKNYGFNVFSSAVGVEAKSDEEKEKMRSSLNFEGKELVENSNRFSIPALISRSKERKYVDMSVNSVVYPFWENIARYEERDQILHLKIIVVLLIIPLATILYLIYLAMYYLNVFFDKLTIKMES